MATACLGGGRAAAKQSLPGPSAASARTRAYRGQRDSFAGKRHPGGCRAARARDVALSSLVGKDWDRQPIVSDFPEEPRHVAPLLFVSQVMNRNTICLHKDDTLRDALKLFLDRRVSGAPVVDCNGHVLGVLSMTDIMWVESCQCMQQEEFPFYPKGSVDEAEFIPECEAIGEEVLAVKVGDRMAKDVVTIQPGDLLNKAAALMIERKINRLPVVDPDTRDDPEHFGELVGIITRLDVMRCLAAVWL